MTFLPVRGKYRPTTSRMTPSAARRANSMTLRASLDLYGDELVDNHRAHDDADERCCRKYQPWTGRKEKTHIRGRDQHQHSTDRHRQAGQNVASHAALGRHRANLTLQLDSFANGASDRI